MSLWSYNKCILGSKPQKHNRLVLRLKNEIVSEGQFIQDMGDSTKDWINYEKQSKRLIAMRDNS